MQNTSPTSNCKAASDVMSACLKLRGRLSQHWSHDIGCTSAHHPKVRKTLRRLACLAFTVEQGSQIRKACTLQAAKPESRALKALKDSEPTQSPEGPAIWTFRASKDLGAQTTSTQTHRALRHPASRRAPKDPARPWTKRAPKDPASRIERFPNNLKQVRSLAERHLAAKQVEFVSQQEQGAP